VSPLPSLSSLPDAPLIFRIAGWPIETLEDLRCPRFAASVDAFIAEAAEIRAASERLSEAIHREVPKLSDRRDRAVVLHARRYLFQTVAPLPAVDLDRVLAVSGLCPPVRDRIADDDAVRHRLERKRQDLIRRHDRTTAAERSHLFSIASEPTFRKALIVASPSAGRLWERLRVSGIADVPDPLTATIWRYLMRAIGRATPHSLWAGITIEDTAGSTRSQSLGARDIPPAVRVKPDLNLFDTVLCALKRHPGVMRRLTFRANPTLVKSGRRRWRFLHELDGSWIVVETTGHASIARLQSLLRREGTMTLARMAARSGIDPEAIASLAAAGVLWPTVDWPPICADPWKALDGLSRLLPTPDRRRWRDVIGRLREISRDLSAGWADRTVSDIARALGEARTLMNGLLRHYGAEPISADRGPLVIDLIAPFRIAASGDFKTQLRDAVRRCYRFDRGGTGELLARGRRRCREPEILRQLLPLGGFHVGAGGAPAAARRAAPRADEPLEDSWEADAWRFGDRETAEKFLATVRAWTRELAPHAQLDSVETAHLSPCTDEPLPPGSALVLARFTGDRLVVRVGSISPDLCGFYSRFHHLFADGSDAYGRWLTDVGAALERVDGLRPTDSAFRGRHDRNAALRPRLAANVLDPFGSTRTEYHVARDAKDRLHLRAKGADGRVLPFISSAADLSMADPYSAWLQAQTHLIGRPSLLRPLPPLGEELRVWRHLPELVIDGDVVVSPERWHVSADEAAALGAMEPFERFVAWRRIVASRRLPDLVYAYFAPHQTESLLPVDSPLAVEMLARSLRAHPGGLRFQSVFARPDELWLRDARGAHYVTEIVVAWAGDEAFWRELSCGRIPDQARPRRGPRRSGRAMSAVPRAVPDVRADAKPEDRGRTRQNGRIAATHDRAGAARRSSHSRDSGERR
jgi:hypothetical protein